MVRPFPPFSSNHFVPSTPLAVLLFVSAFALVALCAKHSTTRKRNQHQNHNLCRSGTNSSAESSADYEDSAAPPKSPLRTPKRLLEAISNKTMVPFLGKKAADVEEGGVWQKNILMGDKCRPLDFSGVIFYDNYGQQVEEMPRSPLATPRSPLRAFTFPVHT